MATTNEVHSVTVALRSGVSEATLPNNVKMKASKSYAISLEDWGKLSRGARDTVVAAPTFNTKPWIVPLYNGSDYLLDLDEINNQTTVALINADAQAVKDFALGEVVRGFNDSAFKLVKVTSGSEAVTAGTVVVWGGNATSTTTAVARAQSLVTSDISDVTSPVFAGVAIGTITAGSFGWIQISGVATANVLASTDAGDSLKLSTTDGSLTGFDNEVQTLTLTGWSGSAEVKLTWDGNESTNAVTFNATRTTEFQAAIDELAIASTTYPAALAGEIVVTRTDSTHYVFTFSGTNVKNTDVGPISITSGAGTPTGAGTFAETNPGAGATATGATVGSARSAADSGTALVEIKNALARNLRSRERDLFRNARN
jgi:hypothetical protein